MRGDDEIPKAGGEGSECVGTCLSKVRSDLKAATPDEILHELQDYCESPAMIDFCRRHGVNDATFDWNPRLQRRRSLFRRHPRHGKLYQQFWNAYQNHSSLNLALAFHGTAESNVPQILHYGLDPQYRRTQAFGKGEYFSKEPGLSATYRKEGHCLLVFLLLMPKDHEKVFSQKDRDIIVVPEMSQQLPLGVLRFDSVDERKIQHSQSMRLEQRRLKETAKECDWRVAQAKLTNELTLLWTNGQFEQAAATLRQATKYHKLSVEVQEDLAARLQEYMPEDAEARTALYPLLAAVEPGISVLDSRSISELEAQAGEAWRAFLAMKMDPNRNILVDTNKPGMNNSCALQLQQQARQLPGVRVALQ